MSSITHDFSHMSVKSKLVLAEQLKGTLRNEACSAIHEPVKDTLKQLLQTINIKK